MRAVASSPVRLLISVFSRRLHNALHRSPFDLRFPLFPCVTVGGRKMISCDATPLALVLGVLLLALPILAACGSSSTSGGGTTTKNVTLNVFAATSLTGAFTEMGKNFESANPGVKVVFNFAGSQQLATQIGQGADADVFASANTTQMTNSSILFRSMRMRVVCSSRTSWWSSSRRTTPRTSPSRKTSPRRA